MADWRDAASTRLGRFPTNKVMLIRDEDGDLQVAAFLLDAEIDPFRIDFQFDGTFTIKTDDFAYLMLDEEILDKVKELLRDAKKFWEELDQYFDDNHEFVPPEELITSPIEPADSGMEP